MTFPRRGEVWLVRFDPTLGAEIKKTRPALILQNDLGNRVSDLTIVAAITSTVPEALFPIQISVAPPEGGLEVLSIIQLNQIRTVDKRRLVRLLGRLSSETMSAVEQALVISLGLVEF